MGLPREHRIRKSRDFERLRKTGRWIPGRYFHLQVAEREAPPSRLGLAVSRRVGSAVVRNRVKRRFREIFRGTSPELERPLDVVVIARKGVDAVKFSELKDNFSERLRRWRRTSESEEWT